MQSGKNSLHQQLPALSRLHTSQDSHKWKVQCTLCTALRPRDGSDCKAVSKFFVANAILFSSVANFFTGSPDSVNCIAITVIAVINAILVFMTSSGFFDHYVLFRCFRRVMNGRKSEKVVFVTSGIVKRCHEGGKISDILSPIYFIKYVIPATCPPSVQAGSGNPVKRK
jgi:hypothetical protein